MAAILDRHAAAVAYPFTANIPCADDPRWSVWTLPLYKFLSKPKTWNALESWRKQYFIASTVMLNLLGWLSYTDKIDFKDGVWFRLKQKNKRSRSLTDRQRLPKSTDAGSSPVGSTSVA